MNDDALSEVAKYLCQQLRDWHYLCTPLPAEVQKMLEEALTAAGAKIIVPRPRCSRPQYHAFEFFRAAVEELSEELSADE